MRHRVLGFDFIACQLRQGRCTRGFGRLEVGTSFTQTRGEVDAVKFREHLAWSHDLADIGVQLLDDAVDLGLNLNRGDGFDLAGCHNRSHQVASLDGHDACGIIVRLPAASTRDPPDRAGNGQNNDDRNKGPTAHVHLVVNTEAPTNTSP